MEQFVLFPYSVYQSQSTLPRKQKLEQKQEKEEIVPKIFESVHSAENARMKTSKNQHIVELILNSPRIRLKQSEIIILDNRDTKNSIVDFVCALKRKNTDFPVCYITILEATQVPPKLVVNKNAKAKDRLKSEKVSLKRLYSRARAAYGSVQNLSKTSGLSKKKVEQFLQTKTSYTKFGPPIKRFRRRQAFSKYINEIWCMDLVFVDKLASQNNEVKYLLVAVDVFFAICQSSNNEN